MSYRSHVGRHMDMTLPSNRLVVALSGVAGLAGIAIWLTGGSTTALWAPVFTFLTWAFVREIDPDHQSPAIAAAIAAGLWVLAGVDAIGALTIGGLMLAARLVTNSTGRRPLITDLVPIGVFATAISFTTTGWIAGFGLAIAIYVDDRMSDEPSTAGTLIASLTAFGSSVVASLANIFPRELPDVRPLLAVGVGVLALIAVVREPAPPYETVDSRLKNLISQPRLHASRTLIAVLVFSGTLLTGQDALVMGPLVIALALALASNEIERLARR